ncbi:pirin family protein [Massilia arenosa]|uniref:Pirin family protein n=1 Tax=Zemynaea arenosa TaxID=2561931 RepID=A0A4Y9SFJ7_9BURK|nr:pirin family protein [Massilia arenosa]TFW22438.1 pirin family protein [Massilia arenosa]
MIAQLLKAHEKDLGGGFKVRRYLPAAARQAVGPFIFFDHFGPIDAHPQDNHDVRPHPHIGLATVTYLYEGAIMHRDSIGSEQRIEPGAINWMTAGRGIVHSERTPPELRGVGHRKHGLQLWCALPREHEEDAPSFEHTPASAIPEVALDGCRIRVLVGSAFGQVSPVRTYSETLYLDVALDPGATLTFDTLPAEAALYAVEGSVCIDGETVPQDTMALLPTAAAQVRVAAPGGTRFVVIGGEALDGHRYIYWNFVSSSRERIVQAADDWEAQRYAMVPGETEFIPLPANRPPRA